MVVSVCVPTYQRPEALERALRHLTSLDAPVGGYEVVVVDDGSHASFGIPALLECWAATSPVPLRWASLPRNAGPAAARNAAWRMADGAWIAFTDDDCRPARDWLVRLLAVAEGSGAQVVEGRTVPDPERVDLLQEPFARSVAVEGPDGYFRTCNILYRRSLLDALDGFDEAFRLIADDTDLGWRATEAGASTGFAADAVVVHDVTVGSFVSDLKSRRRWADVVRMIAKHPGSRRLAWKPYVYRRSHLPVLLIAVLALLTVPPRSRTVALVALGAVIARDVLTAGSPAKARAVLGQRIADGYEIALLARAGLRHRRVLL